MSIDLLTSTGPVLDELTVADLDELIRLAAPLERLFELATTEAEVDAVAAIVADRTYRRPELHLEPEAIGAAADHRRHQLAATAERLATPLASAERRRVELEQARAAVTDTLGDLIRAGGTTYNAVNLDLDAIRTAARRYIAALDHLEAVLAMVPA